MCEVVCVNGLNKRNQFVYRVSSADILQKFIDNVDFEKVVAENKEFQNKTTKNTFNKFVVLIDDKI